MGPEPGVPEGRIPNSPPGERGDDPRRTDPSGGDGRNISADLGLLTGEGAHQVAAHDRSGLHAVPPGVRDVSGHERQEKSPTYYDRPLLKEPVWIWAVPVYFFCGGAAGAAAFFGETARLLGSGDLRRLSIRCRWIAAAGTSAGAALLIYDLGRPARFLNMLRVFRPTSAMSVGSWVLAASGFFSGAAALLSGRGNAATAVSDGAALGSAALGLPLAGYTAVLLSDTAVPVWHEARRSMPPLFVSSAAASAASLLKLSELDERSRHAVRLFGILGTASEMGFSVLVERQSGKVPAVGKHLKQGLAGTLWTTSKVLAAASLAFAVAERNSRSRRVASAISGIAGGLALRFAIFHAGKASARDPRASFEPQRSPAGGSGRE